MTTASDLPQIRVDRVSLVPSLVGAVKSATDRSAFADNVLLDDVSFDVFPGDRIALVGASGAGKTTLLRILNRLSEPTTGTVYLNGLPYTKIPVVELRQQVRLLLQESKLLGMTVREALAYPLQLQGINKKTIALQVEAWMERLAIPGEWGDRTELQLSVGQRQLVAIARALISQPAIVLLDEPTSALDIGRIQQVFHVLMDLNQHQHTTLVMVNHQLDLNQQLANRVLFLENGKLVDDQPATTIDWLTLAQRLKNIEEKEAQEWA